jgi:hypothetical protein
MNEAREKLGKGYVADEKTIALLLSGNCMNGRNTKRKCGPGRF